MHGLQPQLGANAVAKPVPPEAAPRITRTLCGRALKGQVLPQLEAGSRTETGAPKDALISSMYTRIHELSIVFSGPSTAQTSSQFCTSSPLCAGRAQSTEDAKADEHKLRRLIQARESCGRFCRLRGWKKFRLRIQARAGIPAQERRSFMI